MDANAKNVDPLLYFYLAVSIVFQVNFSKCASNLRGRDAPRPFRGYVPPLVQLHLTVETPAASFSTRRRVVEHPTAKVGRPHADAFGENPADSEPRHMHAVTSRYRWFRRKSLRVWRLVTSHAPIQGCSVPEEKPVASWFPYSPSSNSHILTVHANVSKVRVGNPRAGLSLDPSLPLPCPDRV